MWTELKNVTIEQISQFARGCYQLSILKGNEAMSGSTLRGKARKYSGKYAHSRNSLFTRLRNAGFNCNVVRVGRKNVLVISA